MEVLLYDSRLRLFPRKLRSKWTDSYIVLYVFPYVAVEILHLETGAKFKVKGYWLKYFLELQSPEDVGV